MARIEAVIPLVLAQPVARQTMPTWRRMFRNPRIVIGASVLVVFFLAAILAPVISPGDPLRQHPQSRLAPPSAVYPLGTDEFGRDLLSRLFYGSRVSLEVAFGSITFAVLLGVTLGLI